MKLIVGLGHILFLQITFWFHMSIYTIKSELLRHEIMGLLP